MKELVEFIMPKVSGLQSKYNNKEFYCKDLFKDNEYLKRLITDIEETSNFSGNGYIYDQTVVFEIGKDAKITFNFVYGVGYDSHNEKLNRINIKLGTWEYNEAINRYEYKGILNENEISEVVKCVLLYNHVVTKLNSVSLKKAEEMREEVEIKQNLEKFLQNLKEHNKVKSFNYISHNYPEMLKEAFDETERYAMFCKARNAKMISEKTKFEKLPTGDEDFFFQLKEEIDKNTERIAKDKEREKTRDKTKDFFSKIVIGSKKYEERNKIRKPMSKEQDR